jgi:hypothetical protein
VPRWGCEVIEKIATFENSVPDAWASYRPSEEPTLWLAPTVLPLVHARRRDARLRLVGPIPAVREASASDSNVEVTERRAIIERALRSRRSAGRCDSDPCSALWKRRVLSDSRFPVPSTAPAPSTPSAHARPI